MRATEAIGLMRWLSRGCQIKNQNTFVPRKSPTIFPAAHCPEYRVFIDRLVLPVQHVNSRPGLLQTEFGFSWEFYANAQPRLSSLRIAENRESVYSPRTQLETISLVWYMYKSIKSISRQMSSG